MNHNKISPDEKHRLGQIRERIKRLEKGERDPHIKDWSGAYYGDVHFLLADTETRPLV